HIVFIIMAIPFERKIWQEQIIDHCPDAVCSGWVGEFNLRHMAVMDRYAFRQKPTDFCHEVCTSAAAVFCESFTFVRAWYTVINRNNIIREHCVPLVPLFLIHETKVASFELLYLFDVF